MKQQQFIMMTKYANFLQTFLLLSLCVTFSYNSGLIEAQDYPNVSKVGLNEECTENSNCSSIPNAYCGLHVDYDHNICQCKVGFLEDSSSSACIPFMRCSIRHFNYHFECSECPPGFFCRNEVCQCLTNWAYNPSNMKCEWNVPDEPEPIELDNRCWSNPDSSSEDSNKGIAIPQANATDTLLEEIQANDNGKLRILIFSVAFWLSVIILVLAIGFFSFKLFSNIFTHFYYKHALKTIIVEEEENKAEQGHVFRFTPNGSVTEDSDE